MFFQHRRVHCIFEIFWYFSCIIIYSWMYVCLIFTGTEQLRDIMIKPYVKNPPYFIKPEIISTIDDIQYYTYSHSPRALIKKKKKGNQMYLVIPGMPYVMKLDTTLQSGKIDNICYYYFSNYYFVLTRPDFNFKYCRCIIHTPRCNILWHSN